ncbi:MAG: replicative DNA helicase, partial [Bacilli bacterium]|nr:replicative DNA helicase [Bacilli bacterium]
MDIGRIPPHDVDAEQAILGSMLTDKDAVIAALEILKEDAFYREDNKIIFRAITNLYLRNEPIDIITVKAELVEMGDLEKAGGIEYLAELPLKVPTTANIERYVKIVEEKYILRNLISTSNELIALGYDETEEVDSIMDVAERRIFDLAQKKNAKGYTSMKDVLVNSFVE